MLFVPGTIGSSSAAAVLLELVHGGHAPAAIVLDEPDAILLLGLIVAREMGWPTPVAVRLDRDLHGPFDGQTGDDRHGRTDQRERRTRRLIEGQWKTSST